MNIQPKVNLEITVQIKNYYLPKVQILTSELSGISRSCPLQGAVVILTNPKI